MQWRFHYLKRYKPSYMPNKINILIDGVGGDVGQGLCKALECSTIETRIFGACISETSSWLHRLENAYVFPRVSNANYLEFLVEFLVTHNIDIYFPTVDSTLLKVARMKAEIEARTNTIVCVDLPEKVEICDDKLATAKFIRELGLEVPYAAVPTQESLQVLVSQSAFPVIIKPRRSNGSKQVLIATTIEQVEPYFGNEEFIIQEYLPENEGEYTSGIYMGDDGEIKGICTLRRELRHGSTYKAIRVVDNALEANLRVIANQLQIKYINIQSMRKKGALIPFEINGRFSGTTGIISRVFNAPELFIRERLLKESITSCTNTDIFYVMRYAEEIFADESHIQALLKRSA